MEIEIGERDVTDSPSGFKDKVEVNGTIDDINKFCTGAGCTTVMQGFTGAVTPALCVRQSDCYSASKSFHYFTLSIPPGRLFDNADRNTASE